MGQEQSSSTNQENLGNSDIANYNNRSNQLNGNNRAYWNSRGYGERPDDWEGTTDRSARTPRGNDNNRADQLNPNNPKYSMSRGELPISETGDDGIEEQETTSTMGSSVMSVIQTGMLAYGVYQVGREIYNHAENKRQEREREEERRAQQLRLD